MKPDSNDRCWNCGVKENLKIAYKDKNELEKDERKYDWFCPDCYSDHVDEDF